MGRADEAVPRRCRSTLQRTASPTGVLQGVLQGQSVEAERALHMKRANRAAARQQSGQSQLSYTEPISWLQNIQLAHHVEGAKRAAA